MSGTNAELIAEARLRVDPHRVMGHAEEMAFALGYEAAIEAAEAQCEQREESRSYYQSLTADGKVWCQSSSLGEVLEQSERVECTFQKIVYFECTNGWESFDPKAAK